MKRIKRIAVAVAGGTVLAIGMALVVLPGPAIVVIPLGLAILAAEFAWARRWLRSARAVLQFNSKPGSSPAQRKLAARSAWRSMVFLARQVRRTLLPKSRPA